MVQFVHQVRGDEIELHFYGVCALCEKRQYGGRLPPLCRNEKILKKLEQGRADPFRQAIYNRGRRKAVEELSIHFNLCSHCRQWVCDACFCYDRGDGLCSKCSSLLETESN